MFVLWTDGEQTGHSNELQVFVDEMLGNRGVNTENSPKLRLSIDNHHEGNAEINLKVFDDIEVSVADKELKSMFSELSLDDIKEPSATTVKDELLDIIGSDAD